MYRKTNESWMKHLDFELIDILCIEFSFFVSYILRHGGMIESTFSMYTRMGIIFLIFDILVVFFMQSYKGILMRNKWQELKAVFKHITIVQLLFLLYEYVTKQADALSRTVYLVTWIISFVLCFFTRCFWKKMVRKHINSEKYQRNVLIISSEKRISGCMESLHGKDYREFRVKCIAFLEEKKDTNLYGNIPIIYGKDEIVEYVRQGIVDEVLIDNYRNKRELDELVEMFLTMGTTIHVSISGLPDSLPNRFVEKLGNTYVVTSSIKTANSWEIVMKRIMDICGGMVGLIITGIAYVFVAPIIKKQSPGPVFFKQARVGKNGRIFYIYKFRSMYMDAEERKKDLMKYNEMQGLMFKMENDPRIIGSEKGPGKGIGNFIRKTSIDELPQFWNILKGDMSLVGQDHLRLTNTNNILYITK